MKLYIYCPVEDCNWWVYDGGHTYKNLDAIRRHVMRDHKDLPVMDRRENGGIVDEWLSNKLAETWR